MGKDASSGGHADPDYAATCHAEEHQGAAANTIDKSSTSQSKDELEACVAEVDVRLSDRVRIAGSGQNGRKKV